MHPFLERLKQRKLVQWALAYVAGAVALYSAVDAFAEPWGVGALQLRIVQATLFSGFFVAVTLAWYHGERGEQRITGVELLILAGIMGLGALGIRLVTAGLPAPRSLAEAPGVTHLRLSSLGQGHDFLRDFELGPAGTGLYYEDEEARIWYRPWSSFEEILLERAPGTTSTLLSPDGSTVQMGAGGGLELLSLDRGVRTRIVDRGVARVGRWAEDGFIYYQGEDGTTHRVPETGGVVERLGIELQEGELAHTDYQPVGPDAGIFTARMADQSWKIDAYDFKTGFRRTLTEGTNPVLTSTGHLVYGSGDGRLLAAAFDSRALSIGPPEVMATNVATSGGRMNWSLSSDGILAYWEAAHDLHDLVWVSPRGGVAPLDAIAAFDGGVGNRYWSLSPDESLVAVSVGQGVDRNIWVLDIVDGSRTVLTPWLGEDRAPSWLSDTTLAFLSQRSGTGQRDLWSHRSDAVGEPMLIYDHFDNLSNALVGEDGWLVLRTSGGGADGNPTILVVRPGTGLEPSVIEGGRDLWVSNPVLSPDGRWLAYNGEVPTAEGSESYDVFVRPFPAADSRVVISDARGGRAPVWSHDGRQLFYVTDDSTMVAASVETEPSFRVVDRRDLFRVEEGLQWSEVSRPSVRADGTFLFMRARETTAARVVLVFGFFEELEARLPK